MPFVELQNYVSFSMFLMILVLITALFIIGILKGTGACGKFQIIAFPINYSPNWGTFRFIVSQTILRTICSVLGRAHIIPIIPNGTGPF